MGDVEKRQWKLGDECYIAHVSLVPGNVQMEIMPAIVISEPVPWAQACYVYGPERLAGSQFVEGAPFPTEAAAKEWLCAYVHEIVIAGQTVPLTGARPCWKRTQPAPAIGDVLYFIDAQEKQVVEAQVGMLKFEYGRVRVGYDSSPGNPEASNIEPGEWWSSKDEALEVAHERHGPDVTFVNKEELARRTDESINKIWQRAKEYAPQLF